MKALSDSTYVFQHVLRCNNIEWPPTPSTSCGHLDDAEEQKLLERLKRGTRQQRKDAFAVLYKRYYLDVWTHVKNKSAHEDEAKDIFGEVWLRAFKQLPNYEWKGIPIRPWLFRTADRIAKEDYRKQKNLIDIWDFIESELELKPLVSSEPLSPQLEQEADKHVQGLLSRLNEQESEVIILKYFNSWKNTEIAKSLKITPGHVGVIIFRSLEKMRRTS